MSDKDPLGRKIKDIFESSESEGRGGELIDNSKLSPQQVRETAERLALMDIGRPCFVCGVPFDSQGALESIFLGPIGDNNSTAIAHKACFDKRLEEHPEIKKGMGKTWEQYSSEERKVWENAFSYVDENSLIGKLFSRPERSK